MSGRGTSMDKRGSFILISNVTQRDLDKNCRQLHSATSNWKESAFVSSNHFWPVPQTKSQKYPCAHIGTAATY